MPTLDLPRKIVFNMLNQADTVSAMMGILESCIIPDEEIIDSVSEELNEDDEPSDEELTELRPEVVDALLEVEEFDPEVIEKELEDWDSIPDGDFVTI